jgi:hypothetical protein
MLFETIECQKIENLITVITQGNKTWTNSKPKRDNHFSLVYNHSLHAET